MDENERKVKAKWWSARVMQGGNDEAVAGANPRAPVFAVFIGTPNLKGGNGRKRKSAWKLSEESAWADAAARLEATQ